MCVAQFCLQLLFLHSCLIATGCSTSNSSYYVVAPNGAPCPNSSSSSTCQELSYYTSQPSVFFTNNTVFYFLEGHHILDQQVVISGVNNLTLQGLGTIETGHHETVTQSTVVIKCNRSTGGFVFMDGDSITMNTISLTDCTGKVEVKSFEYIGIGLVLGFVNANLAFQQVNNFHLKNVSIQNANGYGLLSINSFSVSIEDCSFDHNHNNVSFDSEYIFIGSLNRLSPGGNALVLYSDAYLTDPLAITTLDILRTNFTFSQGRHYGSGIGLLIYFYNRIERYAYKVDICIDHVVAYGNTGSGNLFIGAHSSTNYTVTINNTLLLYGITLPVDIVNPGFVGFVAGGLSFITEISDHDFNNNNTILVYNSNIAHNEASNVGGISITWHNFHVKYEFHNCIFYNNTGNVASALYVIDIFGSAPNFAIELVAIFNVTFDANQPYVNNEEDRQSAITVEKVSAIGFHDVKVSNNPTTGLVALNSFLVFTGGHNIFINNSGVDGGGLALYGYSFLRLDGTLVDFTANHASRFGGGLYVNQEKSILSQCFFQPDYTKNKLLMSKNTADLAGSAIYGGKIEKCFNTNAKFGSVIEIRDQNGSSVVSSDPQKICLCTDDLQEVDCNTLEYNYPHAIPAGGEFSIPVSAVGNMNGTTPAVIAINVTSTNSIMDINTSGKCENLPFILTTRNSSQPKVKVTVALVGSSFISHLSQPQNITAIVSVLPCPPGFDFSNSSGVCECSSMLKSAFSCNISTQEFSRSGNVWLGYSNDTNCTLLSDDCPLDYCKQASVTFPITDPDPQCTLNRSGVLCGGCADNYKSLMLGSNRCGECSWWYVLLLLVFAVAGILLVALLIALNLTVSVGAINGLIFYANMVKILENNLFSQGQIPVLSQFISWINLDFGIEVCFVPGLTGYIKAWLQFVFPGYIFLILLLIVIFARYSKRLLNLVGTQVVPVLATLFLLSYTKLIRSVIQALYVTYVSCDGQPQAVWFVDGNIRYFSGVHLPLFIFALLVLIFLITPYTLFLLTSPFIEAHLTGYRCFRWVFRLKPVLDAYGGPYNDRFRVWTGFLLLIRVILALITSLSDNPSVSIGALMCTMVILITIHCIAREVYSKWYLNALEIVFLLNLMLLGYFADGQLTMRSNNELAHHGNSIAIVVLLSISFLMLLSIILYHILLRLKPRVDIQVLIKKTTEVFVSKICVKKKEPQSDDDDHDIMANINAHCTQHLTIEPYNEYRESLLANSDFELPVEL